MNKTLTLTAIITFTVGIFIGRLTNPPTPINAPVITPTANESTMEHQMDEMSAHLHGKTGEELEISFLRDMIVHHDGAIEMAKQLQTGTTRPELLKLADEIITAQTAEINMMKKWLAEWFDQT